MSSPKAQKQKIISLSVKDKKLTRLFHCTQLNDKDLMFLNRAYQERQNIHFRYANCFAFLSAIGLNYGIFRFSPVVTQGAFIIGFGMVSHLFWSSQINRRFESLIQPYFQKYQIK